MVEVGVLGCGAVDYDFPCKGSVGDAVAVEEDIRMSFLCKVAEAADDSLMAKGEAGSIEPRPRIWFGRRRRARWQSCRCIELMWKG